MRAVGLQTSEDAELIRYGTAAEPMRVPVAGILVLFAVRRDLGLGERSI